MPGVTGVSGVSGVSGVFGGATYIDKVLGYGPIAYWVLNETVGGIAADQVNSPAQDGAYTGVTLADALGPDGVNNAPLFDGVNDYVNIYSVPLRDTFNGAEGTIMIWAKVFNAGVWTDGASRYTCYLRVDADNSVHPFRRGGPANRLVSEYEAGAVSILRTSDGHAELPWLHFAITFSALVDEVRFFIDGVQDGATLNGLGVWAGLLSVTRCVIGAFSLVPANPWHGWLAHNAIWDSALTPAQIADLATV